MDDDDWTTKCGDYNHAPPQDQDYSHHLWLGGELMDDDVSMMKSGVTRKDLDALRCMVYDMLRNPDLLHISPWHSGAGATSLTASSCAGAAATAVSQSSSSPMGNDVAAPMMDQSTPYICKPCYTPPPPPPRSNKAVQSLTLSDAPRLPFC